MCASKKRKTEAILEECQTKCGPPPFPPLISNFTYIASENFAFRMEDIPTSHNYSTFCQEFDRKTFSTYQCPFGSDEIDENLLRLPP